MRHAPPILTVLLTLAMVGCGGDTHEQAADDLVVLTSEVSGVLEGVEDKQSAEQAKQELTALSDEFRAVGKRLTELGEPDEGLEAELEEKYGEQLNDITKKMNDEVMRIMQIDPSLLIEIQKGMDEIGKAMEEAEPQWFK